MTTGFTSPLHHGARNGVVTGIYLTILFILSVITPGTPLEGVLSTAMAIAFPVLVYRIIRRDMALTGGSASTGTLWLDGLVSIMCGALIAGAVLLVYLRWIDPGFLGNRWDTLVSQMAESPDPAMQEMAEDFTTASANGFVVSPVMFVMTLLWGAAFSGSLLSLLLAVAVRMRHGRRKPQIKDIS